MSETKFMPLFNRLKAIMSPLESRLTRLEDEPGDYSLESHVIGPHGRPIWFGGVQVNKRYVSYHLMPVYVHPELLEGLSDGLKKGCKVSRALTLGKKTKRYLRNSKC